MPAAPGTKTMAAKLSVLPTQEMKPEVVKWIKTMPRVAKLFAKPLTYDDKVDLNPKKWTDKKLSKAMAALVRYELALLANRASDAKKVSDKAKSPMEEIKVVGLLQKAIKKAQADIDSKCSDALEELESGKGEAKAGLAAGKKAMAQINTLDVSSLFSGIIDTGTKAAKSLYTPLAGNDDKKKQAAISKASKDVEAAVSKLNDTGKTAQSVAKYLLDTGKKLKNHENGQLADFGISILKKDVQPELEKLDADMSKLEDALTPFAAALKKGDLDLAAAKAHEKNLSALSGLQATANKAVAAMKSLQAKFKKIENDLK
ncbi:hypothetical protein [uncultured Tateyamaria sp.]|uniref:hypothetical protein n=1 Tax=uncultured Tateyamaria sp. TaxID=455651 RepID=UPI00261601D3|nr:hypothetical protein [uncultured Tateyamaria sp.]